MTVLTVEPKKNIYVIVFGNYKPDRSDLMNRKKCEERVAELFL